MKKQHSKLSIFKSKQIAIETTKAISGGKEKKTRATPPENG